jgi:3-deoxy-manno-octulosonate cytidylyltransferase (CMP-KDO synthetase)
MPRFHVVIPARHASTRLPGKPLLEIGGKPMVQHVVERACASGAGEVLVATDDVRIAQAVSDPRDGNDRIAVMTDPALASGTDRVAAVARERGWHDSTIVVNVQGDEPFLPREALAGAIGRVEEGDDVGTAAAPLDPALVADPARVKVVTDWRGRALYFSRAVIPHRREPTDEVGELYWQHLGIYACTRAALARWVAAEPSLAELAERLEQLRALHCGLTIGVARLDEPALPGVDTPDDLRRAEAHWHALQR